MRYAKYILPLLIAALALPSLAVTIVQLRSGTAVDVSQGSVTLGDIATISSDNAEAQRNLEQVQITYAPPPGQQRVVDADMIRIAVRTLGYDPDFIGLRDAGDVTIRTRSNMVTSDRLIDLAREIIYRELPFPPEAISIERNNTPPDFDVTGGELTITPEPPAHEDFIGLTFIPFAVVVDGELVRRVSLNLTVRVRAPVLVANHSIPRGSTISTSDFRLVERDLSMQPQGCILDAANAIGKRAKMVIASDAVICERMVEDPPLIRSQQQILIQVVCGNVVLKVPGTAMQDGRMGEEIRVVSGLASRTTLSATVVDLQTVLVTIPGGVSR
jgi:flagella basal body P-ring formation protein FlgA